MAVIAPYRCAGLSDPGRKRDNNEDRFHVDAERGIFFVIDGVGGQAAGEKAADTAYQLLRARLERPTGTMADRIREAITVANNEIYALSASNPEWSGMACVLTVAVIEDGEVTVGHVGDSRLYVIENGEIRKLTHDHSPVGEREDRGEIDEWTAMRHPRRNEVFRDVGSEKHSPDDAGFIEISTSHISPSSALLLCSDGLSDLVPSGRILTLVEQRADDPQAAVQALIDAANNAGGKDNVTVVLVQGPRFRGSQTRLPQFERTPFPAPVRQPFYLNRAAFALYSALLALLLAAFFKPHWLDTERGLVFGFGAVRPARTFHVNGNIESALQKTKPGDTVIVPPGTYSEQIRIREGVALLSQKPHEAVVQASGVAISAEGVKSGRLEGFRIISDEGQPLTVGLQVTDSHLEVSDMQISGAQNAGIEILGNSTGTFRANTIAGNPGFGVAIRDSAKPRFVHNAVLNNGRGSASGRPGIDISGFAQPVVAANTVRDNAAEAILAPQMNVESLLRQNFVPVPDTTRPRPGAGRSR